MNRKSNVSQHNFSRPGIRAFESDQHEIVSFEAHVRQQYNNTIRATAMVFDDSRSQALRKHLDRVAPSDATVLVIGETGTGKELVARYIHAQSARRTGPFIAVNCGALSDTLAEAELFGHEKGAFTGALKTQAGWFEAANHGTLMLDEIGDLPLNLQVKLLRVLQEREVVRVGSRTPLPVDVRIIAATNVDLEAAIRATRFREDLFFRLNVASVQVPPLRERVGDIESLAGYFLDLYQRRLNRTDLVIDPVALRLLEEHNWPGNIRELENVIHNAVLLAEGSVLRAADFNLTRRSHRVTETTFDDQLKHIIERGIFEAEPSLLDRTIRLLVETAFDNSRHNQVRTAESLGISRNALRTHLARLGIVPERRSAQTQTRSTA